MSQNEFRVSFAKEITINDASHDNRCIYVAPEIALNEIIYTNVNPLNDIKIGIRMYPVCCIRICRVIIYILTVLTEI